MTEAAAEVRRDPRYTLRADHAFAEFDDPRDGVTRWSGRVLTVSVAGIALVLDARLPLDPGTVLHNVTLHIGACRLEGSISVRNIRPVDDLQMVLGGLFYPGTEEEAGLLMALIAGMESVDLGAPAATAR